MPEPLEPRAAPGGGILEILLGAPLLDPFLGSCWADSNPLGSDELPGITYRSQKRLSALTELGADSVALHAILGDTRRLLDISRVDSALADVYVDVAKTRIEKVADALSDPGSGDLHSREFSRTLWWVDELFTSLAFARGLGPDAVGAEGMDFGGWWPPFNMPPIATDDWLPYLVHDRPFSMPAPGAVGNDTDDGQIQPLSAYPDEGYTAQGGTYSIEASGAFTYMPPELWTGTDWFGYQITDGQYSDWGTVRMLVNNTPPVANADGPYYTLRDIPLSVPAPGVLANDTDADGDPRTAYVHQAPGHGAVNVSTNGAFTYTPTGGYSGTDSFTYRAFDQLAYSQPAGVSISIANMKLYSVTFEDDNAIIQDPPVELPFGGPEWQDTNQDGDANDPGDHKYPVTYVRGETLRVSAEFRLDRPWYGGTILVSATGPDGIAIPWTAAAVLGESHDIALLQNVQAQNTPFLGVVKHYIEDDFNLTWFAKVQGQSGSVQVGTSSNDVYLTLGEPGGTRYHTSIHLGSHYAQGDSVENDVILDVWNNVFFNNSVARVDNMPLWYYHNYAIQNRDTQSLLTPIETNEGRLGDGRCGAWADFMLDVLKAQGIDRPDSLMDIDARFSDFQIGPEGFLVNSWQFAGNGSSNAAIERDPGSPTDRLVDAYPYLNVKKADGSYINAEGNGYEFRFADVTDIAGIEGKGPNGNPASIFPDHQILQFDLGYGPIWFDPSYGTVYLSATQEQRELEFDDGSIAGYYMNTSARVREWIIQVDLNGQNGMNDTLEVSVILIRPNQIGVNEVFARPFA